MQIGVFIIKLFVKFTGSASVINTPSASPVYLSFIKNVFNNLFGSMTYYDATQGMFIVL